MRPNRLQSGSREENDADALLVNQYMSGEQRKNGFALGKARSGMRSDSANRKASAQNVGAAGRHGDEPMRGAYRGADESLVD